MVKSSTNRFFLWRDCAIYLGPSFETSMHSHHAVQCCIALSGEMKIAYQGMEKSQLCRAVIIASNVPHRIDSQGGSLCIIYLEKNTNDFKNIIDYHCIKSNCPIKKQPLILNDTFSDELIGALSGALLSEPDITQVNELKLKLLAALNGYISSDNPADLRISKLLKHIHRHPEQLFSGINLAELVNLSESRMQHLFKLQVGMPIRRYVLWIKLRHVLKNALKGASLTSAAHSAGFADSAHFSRTFKSMFGIMPSLVLNSNSNLLSLLCD